ncbi:MAG: APC family permease, partial [Pseudonocardia sp.]|nr:APC family permease [Pseudonocardia sp.]
AYCNATASAQLAMAYPTSGGSYVYGRERLGHWWGFTAGWGFVVGKTASCAAMALTFASYVVPGPGWGRRLVAAAGVAGLAGLNYRGVGKTAAATRVLVAATLLALTVVVAGIAVGLVHDTNDGARAAGGHGLAGIGQLGSVLPAGWDTAGGYGAFSYVVLQSAGLLFFAFAGYARIATMGEEVRDPRRTIPTAIPVALGIAMAVYLLVGAAVLVAAGAERLASTPAPLTAAVEAAGVGALAPVARVGAALASLGALIALIAGVGRTGLAMARHRDLPTWLAAVHPRYRVPHHAELALALAVCALVLITNPGTAIGFSSFGVLVYYAIANAAALTQPPAQRRWPRALHVLGLAGCLTLAATLPLVSVYAGLIVFAVGLAGRRISLSRRGHGRPDQPA